MHLVTVRDQLTAELLGQDLLLNSDIIDRLTKIALTPGYKAKWEKDNYYRNIYIALEKAQPKEETSRQWVADCNGTTCLYMIQVLVGREKNLLHVGSRSMSARKMRDDLIFLATLAKRWNCQEIKISIGSFHVEIDPEVND